MILFYCGLLFFSSCEKNYPISEKPIETPVIAIPVTPKPEPPTSDVPLNATVYEVGTGSGYLTIDGSTLKITKNALVKIKGGKYKSITIKNIIAPQDQPVFIKNNGEVFISEYMQTDNISNVVIAGDYVSGLTYGFKFENISYRALTMFGKMSGVTLKSMSFKNVKDYSINGDRSNGYGLPYKGTADTRTENFKILSCLFDNAGSVSFGGTLNRDSGEDSGFFKNVEIAFNTFQNIPDAGSMCYFSNVQDFDIHNNRVDNVNYNNNNHNGVFFMQGNGSFHHNKLTNYQGNAMRMWPFSRGTTPATVEIYDNICYNTRKYSAFELQSFDRNIVAGKTTFVNAKVYNNTVGKMNTSKDWEGVVLDLYNIWGTLEYFNNLGFDLYSDRDVKNMINNMSSTKITIDNNNRYIQSQQSAVNDVNNFASKVPPAGATGI